jgi:hypothetical protein
MIEVSTTTTKPGPGSSAVDVRLSAKKFYSNAVEQGETSGPTSIPKGGDLVLWEQNVIGCGPSSQDLARQMNPLLGDDLKSLFAYFLKGWKADKHYGYRAERACAGLWMTAAR